MRQIIIKEVIGYEGHYFFDKKLNIVSHKTGHVKTPTLSNCKYLVMDLYKNGKRKTELVHRLIALTFIENKTNASDVNHKDGNRLNNELSNLEWVSRSENLKHSYRVLGRKCWMKGMTGAKNSKSKKIKCLKNGELFKEYDSIMDAQRDLKIKNNGIVNALKGRAKSAGGYTFKYSI